MKMYRLELGKKIWRTCAEKNFHLRGCIISAHYKSKQLYWEMTSRVQEKTRWSKMKKHNEARLTKMGLTSVSAAVDRRQWRPLWSSAYIWMTTESSAPSEMTHIYNETSCRCPSRRRRATGARQRWLMNEILELLDWWASYMCRHGVTRVYWTIVSYWVWDLKAAGYWRPRAQLSTAIIAITTAIYYVIMSAVLISDSVCSSAIQSTSATPIAAAAAAAAVAFVIVVMTCTDESIQSRNTSQLQHIATPFNRYAKTLLHFTLICDKQGWQNAAYIQRINKQPMACEAQLACKCLLTPSFIGRRFGRVN